MAAKSKARKSKASNERAHVSPPTVFDDGGKYPSAYAIPWQMWPVGAPRIAEQFWHQSWYGARKLAAARFGVRPEHIRWDENYGKTE